MSASAAASSQPHCPQPLQQSSMRQPVAPSAAATPMPSLLVVDEVRVLPDGFESPNLLLCSLPRQLTLQSLGGLFCLYGRVRANLVLSRRQGLSAVMQFEQMSHARAAYAALNGMVVELRSDKQPHPQQQPPSLSQHEHQPGSSEELSAEGSDASASSQVQLFTLRLQFACHPLVLRMMQPTQLHMRLISQPPPQPPALSQPTVSELLPSQSGVAEGQKEPQVAPVAAVHSNGSSTAKPAAAAIVPVTSPEAAAAAQANAKTANGKKNSGAGAISSRTPAAAAAAGLKAPPNGSSAAAESSLKLCAECGEWKEKKKDFSSIQQKKGSGKCKKCIAR